MRYALKENVAETEAAVSEIEAVIDAMVANWPEIIPRRAVPKLTAGLYSVKSMANMDCLGIGPEGAFSISGQRVYPKAFFATWMKRKAAVSWAKRKSIA